MKRLRLKDCDQVVIRHIGIEEYGESGHEIHLWWNFRNRSTLYLHIKPLNEYGKLVKLASKHIYEEMSEEDVMEFLYDLVKKDFKTKIKSIKTKDNVGEDEHILCTKNIKKYLEDNL